MSRLTDFLKKLIVAYGEDNVSSMSAALAYYTIFSLAPVLIICIALTGFFVEAAETRILAVTSGLIDPHVASQIKVMVENASKPFQSEFAHMAGIILLAFGALCMFQETQSGLNRIFAVQSDPNKPWFYFIVDRLLSFAMVLIIALLLLIFLVLSVTLTAFSTWLGDNYGIWAIIGLILNDSLSFFIILILFALMFKILPDRVLRWSDVWVGASITALLFILGKFLLGLYFNYTHIATLYGAAGSLIILLLWVYYSAQIFFIGAEITKLLMIKRHQNDGINSSLKELP